MSRSFLDCPHRNVQEWTECCLDCGYNIYTTREEYLASLRRIAASRAPSGVDETDPQVVEIRKAERAAGVRDSDFNEDSW